MTEKLIKKAQELRKRGFTTGEIADELNVSKDTARWLTLQTSVKSIKKAPLDFAIDWERLGGSSTRMKHVSAAMADLALEYGEIDVVVGIAISGIPFATLMADEIVSKLKKDISLAVFHPIKHRKGKDAKGAISSNFAKVKNKRVLIVDDVITSGKTIKEAVTVLKGQKAAPVVVTVLIDKKGISEVDGVPVTSLIKVKRLG